MTDNPPIQYDHAGEPIRVPPRSPMSYESFASLVKSLTPDCCSYPSGQRTDPKTKMPCRREKCTEDGCEFHSARKAASRLRYGRHLPLAIRKKFAFAATDGELLNIGHDVALVSARLHVLQERLDTGESGKAWESLQDLWTDFISLQARVQQAKEAGETEKQMALAQKSIETMQKIGKVIKSGNENENTWSEIVQLSTLLANLKSTETRRKRDSGQMLDAEQALVFISRVQDVINDNIKDQGTRNRIGVQMATLFKLAGVRSTRVAENAPPAIEPPAEKAKPKGLRVEDFLSD